MIAALLIGTVLSLVALGYVVAPVVVGVKRPSQRAVVPRARPQDDLAIAALREIEFDRATGKLSDADYASLREKYAAEALAAMRAGRAGAEASSAQASLETSAAQAVDDPAEAAVRAYRAAHASCARCGIRPETDAIYCSNCGSYLPGKCGSCGTAVTAAGVRYCTDCGTRLAA